jgi:hypothetical protein
MFDSRVWMWIAPTLLLGLWGCQVTYPYNGLESVWAVCEHDVQAAHFPRTGRFTFAKLDSDTYMIYPIRGRTDWPWGLKNLRLHKVGSEPLDYPIVKWPRDCKPGSSKYEPPPFSDDTERYEGQICLPSGSRPGRGGCPKPHELHLIQAFHVSGSYLGEDTGHLIVLLCNPDDPTELNGKICEYAPKDAKTPHPGHLHNDP